jgi:putative ABC transport system permease protein
MLQLIDIVKDYGAKDNLVHALKGINLKFREKDFVAILGPSGCGKTTFLNIIGGLDRYTSGDLIIDGKSTKQYGDRDWDNYRNKKIGFVFQSYNLIPHQSVLSNVELAMSLAGVSKKERKQRAEEALIKVGLGEKLNKRPSELSGGQMQRVAIARALVNNPSIILADEPTGALDTDTGLQIMEALQEVAKTRTVIMVTHNPALADQYATRIIQMLDGKVVSDSKPVSEEEEKEIKKAEIEREEKEEELSKKDRKVLERKSAMSIGTAVSLSAQNLKTKASRSFLTSFACSIGIIGMAVILSVSNGTQAYVDQTMAQSTATNYLTISANYIDYSAIISSGGQQTTNLPEYPSDATGIYPYQSSMVSSTKQDLTSDYVDYVKQASQDKVIGLDFTYQVGINAVAEKDDGTYYVTGSSSWDQVLDNTSYIGQQYDTLAAVDAENPIPDAINEAALVVDSYNRLSTTTLTNLGISYTSDYQEIKYDSLLGKEYKVILNDDYYLDADKNGIYSPISSQSELQTAYEGSSLSVKITSILRAKKSASSDWIRNGLGYSSALTQKLLEEGQKSNVSKLQAENKNIDITTGKTFATSTTSTIFGTSGVTYDSKLAALGYTSLPSTITIYPSDFKSKDEIKASLDKWNEEHTDHVIKYTDISTLTTQMLGNLINIITYVLVAFSAISLVISSIMIAIIIYASVIERTKEIGVLRAMGARKKDVARIFRSEAIILGGLSGLIALGFALIDNAIINTALAGVLSGVSVASMTWLIALAMMALAIVLPLIASLIPARLAANKDPVVALRSE